MNILLTSVGRRSYLVKYFKQAIGANGEVHVSNSTAVTPAFSCADKSIVTPLIYENDYIPFLIEYCLKNKIDAVISLFDVDLPILAKNKDIFEAKGTKVLVSNEEVINICNDKWKTYQFLIDNGFNTPKTFISLELVLEEISRNKLNYPLVVKPRWGMGSIGVYEAENDAELRVFFYKIVRNVLNSYLKYESVGNLNECVIIQEKLSGQEYGLDVINNLKGEYQNTIVKVKHSMRSGETDCGETVFNNDMKRIGEKISQSLKHIGNMDMDVFLDNGKVYVLELNARFGGGYPFSHMAGVNLPLSIIKWLNNEEPDISLLTETVGIISHKDIEIIKLIENTGEINE